MREVVILITVILGFGSCGRTERPQATADRGSSDVDSALLLFREYEANPVFTGTEARTWDRHIRERGFILFEDSTYHLWYTGFADEGSELHLGYAVSSDGITWSRHAHNPIVSNGWVEDMMVVKEGSTYYMFAEGKDDIAHMLVSTDRVHWEERGPLDIRYVDGSPLSPGPYGTPTAWLEDGTWYLLYERGDLGIWLATSADLKTWTNVQDEPVLTPGPEEYDKYGVAVNQVLKHNGKYYAYYHATDREDWSDWNSCVAVSDDRIHWTKYAGNPILRDNKSSPIVVSDGEGFRLYTMHPAVALHLPGSTHAR